MFALCVGAAPLLVSSAASAKTQQCTASDLSISEAASGGGGGSFYLHLAFRNRTRTTCVTGGYSGITLLGSNRRALGVAKRGSAKGPSLVVAPGKSVYEQVVYGENAANPKTCPAVKALRVFVPNSNQAKIVTLPNGSIDCGGAVFVYLMAKTRAQSGD